MSGEINVTGIKDCPCCAGKSEIIGCGRGLLHRTYMIWCLTCRVQTRWYTDIKECIETWNTRSPIANNGVSLEEFRMHVLNVLKKRFPHVGEKSYENIKDAQDEILAKLQPTAPRGLLINCDKCGEQLKEPGALEFSPPKDGSCQKRHICVNCYNKEPK